VAEDSVKDFGATILNGASLESSIKPGLSKPTLKYPPISIL
jgi:hypothetical protein